MIARSVYLGLVIAAAVGFAAQASAQAFGSLQQDARVVVPSIEALGRGGAGIALPRAETALFYNPAHLARLNLSSPRITIVGASVAFTPDVPGTISFIRNEFVPLVEDGLTQRSFLLMTEAERQRVERVYEEALDRGRRPGTAHASAFLPSVMLRMDNLSVGAGAFGHATTRARFTNSGGGIPEVDLYGQADLTVPVAGAVVLPDGVALGVTAKYTRRDLVAKQKVADSFDSNNEQLYALRGTTLAFDVGAHYPTSFPGLSIGVVAYNLIGGGFTYELDRSYNLVAGADGPPNEAEVAELEARFNERSGRPSFGFGAAYTLPNLGPLPRTSLALDYLTASSGEVDQSFLTHFRLGATTELGPLEVSAGFSQGLPSVGVGVFSRFARISYALYGLEEGRTIGQRSRMNHAVQIVFGLF